MSIRRFILHTKMLIQHGLYLSRSSRMDDAIRPLDVMRLEDRILFSASVMAPVIAQVAEIAASAAPFADAGIVLDHTELFAALQSAQADELSTLTETSATNDAASSDPLSSVSQSILDATNADNTLQNQPGSINPTLELVFIDSSVSNFEQLAADLQNAASADPGRKLELVALDNTKDGIAQITSTLLKHRGVDGIHIVSRGGTGRVQIGSTWLSMDNLDTYRNAISAWQYSLSDNADLLFYGCSLEASAEGRQLLTDLSELTQSVVADTVNPAFDTVQTMNAAVTVVNARDVVLVDRQLDNSALLADAVQSGSVLFMYDGTSESATSILDRVAAWSQESQTDIRTLSILSHGVAGGFELGNQWITTSTLDATAADWKQVARHFVQDADIYILGCNVGAAGGGGQQLLNELAFTTSAEVYASDNVTGVGGDWILEMASAGNAMLDAAALGQVFDVTELQATNVSLAWYNASWQYRQAVTVSASLLDGLVDETNFTILVDVTQASLKSTANGGNVAQTDGGDILFTLSDGTTKLSHQIESYDAVTGRIKAWVNVPTLSALSNTSLYAYYGNAAAADQWNDSGTWNSSYGGVWHLSNNDLTDSTANNNDGSNVGSTNTTGIIEEGRAFNGSSQNITVADSNSLDAATLITISAWINPTVNDNSWRSIVGKGPDSPASNYWFGIRQSQLEFWTGGTGYDSNVNISLNTWSHVASTFNASTNTLRIYVNGAEIYSNTSASANPSINSDLLYIGRSSLNNEWWQGSLDEVRFQNTEESANEIESQYRTQSSPGTYVTFSSEEGTPTITSNGGGATASISIAENSTAVTTVVATDPGTPTQTLTYSISGGVDAARFAINSSSGVLTFVSAPDFESPTDTGANNVYDVIVQVSDGALTDTQAIAVTVTNVNDAPTATNLSTAESYTEDTALNLTDIVVSDVDSASVTVTLTLSNTAAGSLNTGTSGAVTSTYNAGTGVWTASGAIANVNTLLAALTFTPAANFNSNFTIATSVSDGSLSATGTKSFTGTAVNDAPTITSSGGGATASFSVAENTLTAIIITSSDVDGGTPAFSITGGTDAAKFTINSLTGELAFVNPPNFELPGDAGGNNGYDVIVQVSDGAGGTDSQAISVTITNVNEAPIDQYAVPAVTNANILGYYSFTSANNLGRDDAGDNQPMTLFGSPTQTTRPGGSGAIDLSGGQYGNIASMTTGGAMTIAGWMRFDSTSVNGFERVIDLGQTDSGGIGNIYIARLGTSNDLTFTIEKNGSYTHRATLTNGITNGTWMHVAATVDASGNMTLYVNGSVAATATGVALDVGIRTNHFIGRSNFSVDGAFDGAIDDLIITNGAMSAASVSALYQQTTGLTVAENAANTTLIGTILTSDPDPGNTYTYTLTDNAGGRFAIDTNSGQITVANSSLLDFETNTSHTMVVRSTDQGGLFTERTMTIGVTNVNEAPADMGFGTQFAGNASTVVSANGTVAAANDFTLEIKATPRETIVLPTQENSGINAGNNGGMAVMADQGDGAWGTAGGITRSIGLAIGTNGVVVYQHSSNIFSSLLTYSGTIQPDSDIAVVLVNKTPTLYINGVQVATGIQSDGTTVRASVGYNSSHGIGGGASVGGRYFNGTLSDYRVWDSALNAATINNNRTTAIANGTPGLLANMIATAINENAGNGTVVGRARGYDPDAGATFGYTLANDAGGRFAINNTTGEITVANGSLLDFETNSSHSVTVRVTNGT